MKESTHIKNKKHPVCLDTLCIRDASEVISDQLPLHVDIIEEVYQSISDEKRHGCT